MWNLLPSGSGCRAPSGFVVAVYLTVVPLAFSGMMGQRLLASATGRTMDMTMREAGSLDWGEPFLRDPIVFFSLACPVMLTAILGLWRGTDWEGGAASLSNAFIVSIVSIVLSTGPLKEYLQTGTVLPAMWGMSTIMVLAAPPAVWAVSWLAHEGFSKSASTRRH